MSTPRWQRCPTRTRPRRPMESLWAKSRRMTAAVSLSLPRWFPRACRTRASSGSPTTLTRWHNQGRSQWSLNINLATWAHKQDTDGSDETLVMCPVLKEGSVFTVWACKIYNNIASSFRKKNAWLVVFVCISSSSSYQAYLLPFGKVWMVVLLSLFSCNSYILRWWK